MQVRRCAIVLLEPRERVEFDLELLLQGESGLRASHHWIALAPHVGAEIELDARECEALGGIGETQWLDREAHDAVHGAATIDALLAKGLLVAEAGPWPHWRERDDKVRATHWRALSAVTHCFSRWEAVDSGKAAAEAGLRSTADLAARYGAPPHHFHARVEPTQRLKLPRPESGDLDALLARRTTCRNYDTTRSLDHASFARMLQTVFGAQAAVELAPGSAAVKKTSPSGGSLHPTEAYLLVQRVQGVEPGLYHYHAGDHALEPLAATGTASLALANRFVAGQHWFADAHVLAILAPRFLRTFWKYRNHAKAYRALTLDAGHLSQTLYLAATELGLGAFITSAINEIEIERAFGLDPLDEGPLAVCGFGWRANEKVTIEFDPLGKIWPG